MATFHVGNREVQLDMMDGVALPVRVASTPALRADACAPTKFSEILASDCFIDTKETPLTPYMNVADHFRQLCSPARILVVLICFAISIVGFTFVDKTQFQFAVTLHDISSLAGCKHYCERSSEDKEFSKSLGGIGLCVDEDGESLVRFEVCHRASGGGITNCVEIKSDADKPSDDDGFFSEKCTIQVVPIPWKPYAAVTALAIAITLIVQGGPAEILLLGGASILCALRVIEPDQVFAGLSNSGVCGLAVLFPIAEAIGETGMLEKAMGLMLGTPKNLLTAIPRMMIPVALLSSLLSNTATVAMMIPVVVSWSRRLDVHPGKLLMPLSFAAQLGGSCTLLGSSHVLVAKTAVPASLYNMGFFDLTPIGAVLCVLTTTAITLLAPTRFLSSSEDLGAPLSTFAAASELGREPDVYEVQASITRYGGIADKTIEDAGLMKMKGVSSVSQAVHSDADSATGLLNVNDELKIECNEAGLISIRGHPGLMLANQADLSMLGAGRSDRSLYEVTLHPLLDEMAIAALKKPDVVRRVFGAALVAGPKAPAGQSRQLTPGCVLLFEADKRFPSGTASQAWSEYFSLVRQIPNSSPPRMNLPIDTCRNVATCLGMVLLIICTTLEVVNIAYGGAILLMFYLLIRAITVQQLFGSIKGSILLIIAGALAMASALETTGVVQFVSVKVMAAAAPLGFVGIVPMVYIISVVLSMFINNSATIAILAPMVVSMSHGSPDTSKLLVWTLVLGAGTCFTTPLGYQTNLMVMPDGKYSFGDFARFGGFLQLIHGVLTVAFICLYAQFGSTDQPALTSTGADFLAYVS